MTVFDTLNPEKSYLKNAKALIFDLDGTLIDSMKYWRPAESELANYSSIFAYVREKYSMFVEPKAYAVELLTLLRNNDIPFCIATDTPYNLASGFFARCDLPKLANFYISSDDVGCTKYDSPKIYFEAASRLGADVSECVVFEDYLTSATTAKQAGFTTVGVYDAISRDDIFTMKRLCDDYIYNLGQLMK